MHGQGFVLGLTGDGRVRGHLRDERGSNAVEFALVLPIFLALVFGILWGGIAYNRQLALTQSAREGARFGATLPVPPATPPAPPTSAVPDSAWFDEVRARIVEGSAGELAADGSLGLICIRHINEAGTPTSNSVGSGTCDATSFPGSTTGPRVQVLAQRTAKIDLIMYAFEPTLTGRSVARFEVPSR